MCVWTKYEKKALAISEQINNEQLPFVQKIKVARLLAEMIIFDLENKNNIKN